MLTSSENVELVWLIVNRCGFALSLMLRRNKICALLVLLIFFLMVRFGPGRNSSLEGDAVWQGQVMELASLRLQVSVMRDKLSSIGVDPDELMVNSLPTIYIITPTKNVPTQKADLTRMMNTLRHVASVHWIVVEDGESRSGSVHRLLSNSGLVFTHLAIATPRHLTLSAQEPRWRKPRGVLQRNAGIEWLRANVRLTGEAGVVYFADDDNTYSLQLFAEMRSVRSVGVWPVGLVGGCFVERPAVTGGRVTGWQVAWRPERPFATDMAGFAVSTRLLLENPEVYFSIESELGFLESDFLSSLGVRLVDLEVKASMCTQVLVWHTQTKAANLQEEMKLKRSGKPATNVDIEV